MDSWVNWETVSFAGAQVDVLGAIEVLATSVSDDACDHAYKMLDNSIVVQGTLYGAAPYAIPFLLDSLINATAGKKYILEMLVQLSAGYDAEEKPVLTAICQREAALGYALYVNVLKHTSNDEELSHAIDLVGLATSVHEWLLPRTIWYMRRVRERSTDVGMCEFIDNWLSELEARSNLSAAAEK